MCGVVKARRFRHDLLKKYPGGFSTEEVSSCAEELGISEEDLWKTIEDFVSKGKLCWVRREDGFDYLVEAHATGAKT